MKEIETKIPEKIRQKLLEFGAKKVFSGEMKIIKLDFPEFTLKKRGELLRIRQVGDNCELCFKGKKEKALFKVQEEVQIISNDFATTQKIFEKLGFNIVYEGKKHRETYKLKRISFEIDSLDNVPPFLEIEAPTEKEVLYYIEKLGYTLEQTTNKTSAEVEELYKKKHE
ncbi:class IV adenylate cyclase [Candidatus Woesearchaeota archaeon]|nr:class IV adenylate cyclase [Candidatus Woesearchaeota archaeon]